VKEKNIRLPKIKNHQDDSTITCIDNIYKESFNKFIIFHWIVKFIVPIVGKIVTIMRQCKFPKVQAQRTIIYIPITCTTTTYEDLDWIDFASIFYLINISVFTYEHALNKFINLIHFLFSWPKHKKDKGIPLVGLEHMPSSFWRLHLGKPKAS